jgi:hypothetical protein
MPNGWSFNWESMEMREGKSPRDTLCRKLACCLSACVFAMSNECQMTVSLSVRANDRLAPQHRVFG